MTLTKTNTLKHGNPQEEYFRTVSPMCRKILDDMASIRESYGSEWDNLSYDEQCRIVDQSIVDEATVRRYETETIPQLNLEYFPKLRLVTGQKIVSDEKLTARGYSCIWRDEHSAPFSWHTRSQMDLTLDTPPPTPTRTTEEADVIQTDKNKTPMSETNSLFSAQMYKTQPFLWHYDPHSDARPPDPPDLVVASLSKAPSSEPLISRTNSYNHVVVRNEVDGGVSGWMKGALNFFAGSCIPLQSFAHRKTQLHPGSPFMHPELRPPHVIAKAAKVYIPVVNQPKPPMDILKSSSKNSSKDLSSVDTSFTVCDNTSEGSTDGRRSSGHNKSTGTNRNSILSTSTSPSENVYTITEEVRKSTEERPSSKLKNIASFESYCSEEYPLAMMQSEKPSVSKPGFDFLYNW